MIDTLSDADRFCVLAFDSIVEMPTAVPAGLVAASRSPPLPRRGVPGDGRGPRRHRDGRAARPGRQAARHRPRRGDRDRILVLVTDGQVGNEDQILETLGTRLEGDPRLHARDRSRRERGIPAPAGRAGRRLVRAGRVGGPARRGHGGRPSPDRHAAADRSGLEPDDLAIEPGEVVPRRLPDLFAGSPLLILGRYRGRPAGIDRHPRRIAPGDWSEPVDGRIRDNPAIAAAWARGRIRQLEDRYAAGDGDRPSWRRLSWRSR